MLKKIGLYSLLFVMVTLSTAAVIVFLNRQPNIGNVKNPDSYEDMTLTNIMNATMTLENYRADIKLISSDKSVYLVGGISVLDLADNPSAEVAITGAFNGQNMNIRAKYKNGKVYASINGFGIKIQSNDLADIIDVVFSLIAPSGDNSGFDINTILAGLQDMQVNQNEEGYNLSLKLDGIGNVNLVADTDYIPVKINADNLNLLGKQLSFSLAGECGKAPSVIVSATEENDYIDMSDAKELITGIANTVLSSPMLMDGFIDILGERAEVKFLVDQNANAYGTLKLKNIFAELYYYESKLYINICGTKVICSLEEVLDIVAPYLKIDLDKLLSDFSISKNSLCIAGLDFNFDVKDNYVHGVSFNHQLVSGALNIKNTLPQTVNKPEGYENALSAQQVADILNDYFKLLQNDEFSFMLNGNYGNLQFDLNGYIKSEKDKLQKLYFGNRINGIPIHFWNDSNITYALLSQTKVKFNNSFSSNMMDYLVNKFNLKMPDMGALIGMLSNQVKSLLIEPDGNINVVLQNGLELTLGDKSGDKTITVRGKIANENVNISICILKLSSKHKGLFSTLSPNKYTDMSSYGDMMQSAINTLTNEHNVFTGNIKISGLLGKVDYITISARLESWFVNNKLEFVLTLDNLPTTCFITDTTAFKYTSQKAVLSFKNGVLSLKRTAQKLTGGEDVRLEKTYKLQDISLNIIQDIFGFGGAIGKEVGKVIGNIPAASTGIDLNSLLALEKVDGGLAASLKTSKLVKQLSDTSLTVLTADSQIDSISLRLKASVVLITANFTRAK